MKRTFVFTLGLCALLAGSVEAAPVAPRERVRLGLLVSVDETVLTQKPVVLSNGQYLGWIETEETIGNMIARVKVLTDNSRKAVWLFREDLKYDPQNKVVVTSRSAEQIKKVSLLD